MGMGPVIVSGLLQGFGLGCTFVPLNTIALSTLPRELLTQGTALRSVVRNIGGSMFIAILINVLTSNAQIVHSRLVEQLRPDNPLAQAPLLPPHFSLTNPSGIAALNAEVTRQAEMVAYINDFAMMMLVVLLAMPVLLLVRRQTPRPAAASGD
jgi:DHA2 family multidrug resistance protein